MPPLREYHFLDCLGGAASLGDIVGYVRALCGAPASSDATAVAEAFAADQPLSTR
jgi:hypothetical protein